MVARTHPGGALVVSFWRDDQEIHTRTVPTGKRAWHAAINILSKFEELQHGDCLKVTDESL
jgi:hypothetical protein